MPVTLPLIILSASRFFNHGELHSDSPLLSRRLASLRESGTCSSASRHPLVDVGEDCGPGLLVAEFLGGVGETGVGRMIQVTG